jgi:hypothetical protein
MVVQPDGRDVTPKGPVEDSCLVECDSWNPPFAPIKAGMARISHFEEIEVHAPVGAAFAVIADEILAVEADGHRPIDDGPLRVGFRWQQTVVHERAVCRSDWVVTELREPYVLEQLMEHLCLASRRQVLGGERWEFQETADGSTVVTLRAWREREGVLGWLERLFASRVDATGVSLRKRLAHVQLRAERPTARTA